MDYFVFIISILIGTYLLDITVDILNVRHLATDLPKEFEGFYGEAKYKKSQEYLKENAMLGIISNSIMTPLTIIFVVFGGFNFIDQFARGFNFGTIATGLIFTGALMLISQVIQIPFSAYDTFVIEEKYGFNKTTAKIFVIDILKSWLLVAVLGGSILSLVLWFFEWVGQWAWLYCWIVTVLFQVFILFIAPVVIMPIFNKFTPLKEGELKEAIESYAGSQGFKMKGVYSMDGSKRSTKSNAFFTGFGRFRRIVLFDTLIERHSVEELVSVLAHEMGHYKKKHILKSIVIAILTTGLMFYILSFFINNRELFNAFKMHFTSIYASLVFFGFLYAPIEMIISIFVNKLSRRHEYEADAYALKTYNKPESMISALKKLSAENLSNLTPHPLKVFLGYSHPPVLDRIKALRRIQEVIAEGG